MSHYTVEEIAAARAEYPEHWLVKCVTKNAVALVAIPITDVNTAKIIDHFCLPDANLIDGRTFHCGTTGAP